MRVAHVNVGTYGSYVMSVPLGAKLQSSRQLSNTIEVYYSYDGDGSMKETVDIRVVGYNEQYDDNYIYLAMVVNPNDNSVNHVLYRQNSLQINPYG